MPLIGFHSTIESPEPVTRVAPPTMTIANTCTTITKSQILMARRRNSGAGAVPFMMLPCSRRGGPYSEGRHPRIFPTGVRQMTTRQRKFIGAIVLLMLILSWALIAMAIAQFPAIKANGLIEGIYY